jgi:hypothetical protein
MLGRRVIRGKGQDELFAYHHHRLRQFYFDENRFPEAGYRLVAQRLFEYLVRKGLACYSGG